MDATLIFIVVLFALFWLLLIRPQRRRHRMQNEMIESLRVGDEVLTAGGLYGEITRVGEDEVRLEIAPGMEVRVAKRAVAGVVEEPEEEEEAAESEERRPS